LDAVVSHYTLTKKTFLAGAQCLKRMWWEMYDPSAPETRPTPTARFRMEEGAKVGVIARTYVPGGRLIKRGGRSLNAILADTREALADQSVPAIYEAAVLADGTLVFPDILQRTADGFVLIEVKSKTSVSELKHVPDVAIQAHVLRAAGVPIVRCEVMHLNRECVYPDLSNLFTRVDVTELVEARLATIAEEMRVEMITARLPIAPNIATGSHCRRPDPCPFIDRCWPAAPTDHIGTLYKISEKMLEEFEASGWDRIRDLPDEVKLSAIAARQRRALREGHTVVEREALLEAMKSLTYPIAHIDFETVQPAIPIWDGCRPYDQVPVQLSCHLVRADHSESHSQFLFDGQGDPRPAIAEAILEFCAPAATVTAYNAQFERGCIELVAAACPDKAALLKGIADTLVDLQPIVRENVYDEKFGGSFSIKKVLPALVPGLGYDDLRIGEAETASVQLARVILGGKAIHPEEREELRQALLEYCKRDTAAMVALSNKLAELAS
jgi:hypothetical protein